MTLILASTWRHTAKDTAAKQRLVEDWKVTADCKETVGILSTDMSKAFDSLHSALMLNKLKGCGFTEDALSLVCSYFEDRQYRAKLGSIKSAWKDVKKGCPQGSSFGPLLQTTCSSKLKTANYPCTQTTTDCTRLAKPLEHRVNTQCWHRAGYHMVRRKPTSRKPWKIPGHDHNRRKSDDTTIAVKLKETEVEQTVSNS